MTWNKCSDALPNRVGDILVKINGNLFLGYVYYDNCCTINLRKDFIIFMLPSVYGTLCDERGKWQIPAHFREPDEWMYVP